MITARKKTWFGWLGWDGRRVAVGHDWPAQFVVFDVDDDVLRMVNTHLFVAALTRTSVYLFREDDVARCWHASVTDAMENMRFEPCDIALSRTAITASAAAAEVATASKFLPATDEFQLNFVSTEAEILVVDNRHAHTRLCVIHTDELFRNNKDEVLRRCIPFPEPVRIVRANSGSDFCVFVDAEGAVYSIGTGIRGELGVGNVRVVDEPVRVEALEGVKVVDVKCGKWHTLALTDTGDVYVWGYNEESQIGDNLAGIEWFPCPVDVSLRLQPGDEEDRTVRIEAAAESSTIHVLTKSGFVREIEFGLKGRRCPAQSETNVR